ncbi:MAG: hypothetical protein WCP45_04750 [Verrucomicrobiota bacterium]
MYPPSIVRFPFPFTLSLLIPEIPSDGPRPRVAPQPSDPFTQGFQPFPLIVRVDPELRLVIASLPPIPAPLILFGPADYQAAASASMDDYAARVIELCGPDPAAVLQPLIDDPSADLTTRAFPPRSLKLLTISKLKLILALEAIGLEDDFFAYLASDVKLQRRWDACQFLAYTDPLVTAAIPIFAAATNQPESAITTLLISCAA